MSTTSPKSSENVQRLEEAMKRAMSGVRDLLPQLCDSLPLITRATEISSTTRHGVYDCLYLALSEREGCDLVTSDEKLIKNFPNANIIHIKDL